MFTSKSVEVGTVNKYQTAGVSEKVQVTEVKLNHNEAYGTKNLELLTINENGQEGRSKRMSLKTEISEGKKMSAWDVSARGLLNILMSTGLTREQADGVLEASDENQLVKNLSKALIGKPFRGLFSSKEYAPGKFAVELYVTEPIGGTKLVWNPDNEFYNSKLPKADVASGASSDGLPF